MSESLLPGQRLRAERTSQGLTEDEICARLRLSRSYLRALEEDDYERLPEATFIKGYLRNYARLLGLPAEELVDAFIHMQRDAEPEQEQARDDGPVAAQTALAGPAFPAWMWAGGAALLLILLLVWWSAGDAPVEPADTAVEEPRALPEDDFDRLEPADDADAALDAEPVPLQVPVATDDVVPDQLRMTFSDECWVEVYQQADESRLYQGLQRAGGSLEVEGEGPFLVVLGDASALASLRFNDQTLTVPGGPAARPARLTVP